LNDEVASRTSRLLTLLELLQDRGHASGDELALQLSVDRRTLRRYVASLQELGIPIEGQRGVGGGYRVRPGYRLPPLMFRDEEVVAIVIGLLEARARRLAASADVVDAALAKIYRVLPPILRRQVTALEASVQFTGTGDVEPIPAEIALQLAEALRRAVRVRMRYTAYDRRSSTRRLSPYGLVVDCGFWYLIAYDHGRDDLRTFRVDRIKSARLEVGIPARTPPPGFDPVAHLQHSLASIPGAHRVSVNFDLPLEQLRHRLPASVGVLTAVDAQTTQLHARIESLEWMARVIAGVGCRVQIEEPAELRAALTDVARLLEAS
jgi:predicted DNA-binding transcriptional regulator YafY